KSCTIASNARTSIRLIHIDDCGQARLSSEAAAGSKMRAILTSGRQLIRGDAAAAHAADRDGRARRAIGGDGEGEELGGAGDSGAIGEDAGAGEPIDVGLDDGAGGGDEGGDGRGAGGGEFGEVEAGVGLRGDGADKGDCWRIRSEGPIGHAWRNTVGVWFVCYAGG